MACFVVRIQAGQYTDAHEMLNDLLKLEEESLGARTDKLADIYQLMSKTKSEASPFSTILPIRVHLSNKCHKRPILNECLLIGRQPLSNKRLLSEKRHFAKNRVNYASPHFGRMPL